MSVKSEATRFSDAAQSHQDKQWTCAVIGSPSSPKIRELMERYEAQHALMAANISRMQQSNLTWESDCQKCNTKIVGDSDFVECLTEGYTCPWTHYIGSVRFCKHSEAKSFSKR